MTLEQKNPSGEKRVTKIRKRKGRKRKPMTRSQMMGAVHSEDTKPEVIVRRALFQAGFRYRLHRRDLPGTPDIFIQKYGVAVFVNGCFWHQHGCKLTSRPKSNADFWNEKFNNNIVRDIKTQHQLSLMGIRVAVVWECSLRPSPAGCPRPASESPRASAAAQTTAVSMSADLVLERLMNFIRGDEETIEL